MSGGGSKTCVEVSRTPPGHQCLASQRRVEPACVRSRLRLESDVRKLLREVSVSAEQALSKARELIARYYAVQNELERLGKLQEDLIISDHS